MRRFAAAALLALSLPVLATPEQEINKRLQSVDPQLKADRIAKTPVPGMLEVLVDGQVFYFSADGRYMFQGELVDMSSRQSLTEPVRREVRLSALKQVPAKTMLIYPAKGERKQTITVFTDIDCGYCRKLHEHMGEMNELGIEVRYLAFPRAGLGSDSHRKAVNAWCADQPLEALTQAKRGQRLPEQKCDDPVKLHMAVAQQLGVNATPTIITDRGSFLPGYLPPAELMARLEAEDARAK